jgi:hypothetical protein
MVGHHAIATARGKIAVRADRLKLNRFDRRYEEGTVTAGVSFVVTFAALGLTQALPR